MTCVRAQLAFIRSEMLGLLFNVTPCTTFVYVSIVPLRGGLSGRRAEVRKDVAEFTGSHSPVGATKSRLIGALWAEPLIKFSS